MFYYTPLVIYVVGKNDKMRPCPLDALANNKSTQDGAMDGSGAAAASSAMLKDDVSVQGELVSDIVKESSNKHEHGSCEQFDSHGFRLGACDDLSFDTSVPFLSLTARADWYEKGESSFHRFISQQRMSSLPCRLPTIAPGLSSHHDVIVSNVPRVAPG
jgi:hypothetical protein